MGLGTDATVPANLERSGFPFTCGDIDFSIITSDLTVTAQYASETYQEQKR